LYLPHKESNLSASIASSSAPLITFPSIISRPTSSQIFFVITGMGVDLKTLTNIPVLITALGITFIAFVGKLCSGIVAGKKMNKLLIGFGMVPRGEVGLIFAIMGKTLGVISNEMFSIIVIMVILSTLLTPPILTALLKKHKE